MRTPCQPGPARARPAPGGRLELLTTTFETFEQKIRDQLARMLGAGGFDPARDIRAITVNRWPHGYAYQYNSLFDPFWLEGGEPTPCEVARRPLRPHRHRQRRRRRLLVRRRGHRPGASRGPELMRRMTRARLSRPAPAFARVLGRADLLLFSVSAILTIDTLASAASMGVSWFTWWGITMVLFFIPYGLMTAELGAAWPGEGGLYVWVREAMGPRWGSLAAWFYWINNAYWMPVGLHGVRGHVPHASSCGRVCRPTSRRGRARPGSRRASRIAGHLGHGGAWAWSGCRSRSGCPTSARW